MNDRWVADQFLAACDVDLRGPEPAYVIERRCRLAMMTLAEVDDGDIEGMALHALASAVLTFSIFSDDVDSAADYVKARRAYAEAVGAI